MSRTLPSRSSLVHLKNQAKDLLKAMQAGDAAALMRMGEQLPRFAGNAAPAFTLATAQYVIAREYGFASWPRLKHHLDTLEIPKVTASDLPRPGMVMPVPRQRHAHLLVMAEHLRRKPHVEILTEQVLQLAATYATEELMDSFARMPARLILAVRANVLERNAYSGLMNGLIRGLDHPSPKVRQQAAQAMDLLADNTCVPSLRRALEDPVPRVRRTAFHALSCEECKVSPLDSGPDLTDIWIKHALHDPSIRVRRDVTTGLGELCYDDRIIATLQTIIDTETDEVLKGNARWALHQQRSKA